jgi:hypothetical protein
LLWLGHAVVWAHTDAAAWMPCTVAGPVLGAYLAARWFTGRWASPVLPLAALGVMLTGPGNCAVDAVQAAPAGLLAVLGSFLLFGLGTLAALTRRHWDNT